MAVVPDPGSFPVPDPGSGSVEVAVPGPTGDRVRIPAPAGVPVLEGIRNVGVGSVPRAVRGTAPPVRRLESRDSAHRAVAPPLLGASALLGADPGAAALPLVGGARPRAAANAGAGRGEANPAAGVPHLPGGGLAAVAAPALEAARRVAAALPGEVAEWVPPARAEAQACAHPVRAGSLWGLDAHRPWARIVSPPSGENQAGVAACVQSSL